MFTLVTPEARISKNILDDIEKMTRKVINLSLGFL